ncbi:tetratricopeptide repeat protein [Caminibacter sp.]
MRFFFIIFLFVFSFGYEVFVKNYSDALILKTLGIECSKNKKLYLCANYDDYNQTKQFINLCRQYGIKPVVKLNFIPKTGYCIQLSTSKRLDLLKKQYKKIDKFPLARIEKIGEFYVIRVGESKNYKDLKILINKLKSYNKSAFIRKCDYIPSRIVEGNTKVANNIKITRKNSKISAEELKNILHELFKKGKYQEDLNVANKFQKTIYKKEALFYKAKIYLKLKNYSNACKLFTKLYNIYGDESGLFFYKNKTCYLYYLKFAKKEMYVSPLNALLNIQKALEINDTNKAKFIKGLILYNLGRYEQAYEIFKNYKIKNTALKNMYLQLLFSLNKFGEIKKICLQNNLIFCNIYRKYEKAKELYNKGFYEESFDILKKIWKIYPDNKQINYYLGLNSINMKRINNAVEYLKIAGFGDIAELISKLNTNNHNLQKMYENAFKYDNVSGKEVSIVNAYKKLLAYKLYKNGMYGKALSLIDKIPEDNETLELKAEIYIKLKKNENAERLLKELYSYSNNIRIGKKIIDLYFMEGNIQKAKDFTDFNNKELNDEFYLNLARYYLNKKEIIKMSKALKMINTNGEGYKLLKGILDYYQDNYISSLNELKNLPDSFEKRYYMILDYVKLNNKQEVMKLLKKYFSNIPNNYKSRIANIYIQLDELEKAKKILEN